MAVALGLLFKSFEISETLLFVIHHKLIFSMIHKKREGGFVGLSGKLANTNIYRVNIGLTLKDEKKSQFFKVMIIKI